MVSEFECDDLYQEVCEDSEIGKAEEQSVQVELVCEQKEDGVSNVGEEVEENKEIMGDNSNGEDVMKVECNNMDREDVLEDGCGAEVDDDMVDSDEDEANMKEAQEEEDRRAEVRIGSSVTCIEIENLDEAVFCIAPGEDSVPKYMLMDDKFEHLAFPDLFPGGYGDFHVNLVRERELNLRRNVNQRLLNKDPPFSQNMEYIFAFQYATEIKQLKLDMQMALKRHTNEGKRVNAGDLKNFQTVNQMLFKDIAYKFMKKVRGTPSFWQSQLMDTLAMLHSFGTPTWFISLSPAEFLWPEFTQAVGRKIGKNWSVGDGMEMN